MTASEANILIVGAGPVGLAAAVELCRRGYRPRIIDKGDFFTPVEQSRALGVNNRTLQLLKPSGVTDELLAAGTRATTFRIVNEKGKPSLTIDLERSGGLYPFMLILSQGKTERLLAETLKSYGVEVEWNAEAIASNGDAAKPSIDINRPHGVETIRADMIIGADGSGSFIRKEFGFSFEGEGLPVEFGLADVELDEELDETEAVVTFSKEGPLLCIPMGGRLVRFVSPRPDISKALPKDLDIIDVVWRSSFHINFRHVETMQKEAVFLAGDAAHVHSPAGARGMNLGIEDACWLAWLISQKKTADYSALRLPEVRKVIAQTRQQTNLILHMGPLRRFFRDHIAQGLLDFAPFRRAALERITGLDTAEPPWL